MIERDYNGRPRVTGSFRIRMDRYLGHGRRMESAQADETSLRLVVEGVPHDRREAAGGGEYLIVAPADEMKLPWDEKYRERVLPTAEGPGLRTVRVYDGDLRR